MEEPKYFEDLKNGLKYIVVQRPNYTLGKSAFELILDNKFDSDLIEHFIEQAKYVIEQMPDICPVPPKPVFVDNTICWTDFKYWKYNKQDLINSFLSMISRLSTNSQLYEKAKKEWTI